MTSSFSLQLSRLVTDYQSLLVPSSMLDGRLRLAMRQVKEYEE